MRDPNSMTSAIASEVNSNMGTNVTADSMLRNQTVAVPPAAKPIYKGDGFKTAAEGQAALTAAPAPVAAAPAVPAPPVAAAPVVASPAPQAPTKPVIGPTVVTRPPPSVTPPPSAIAAPPAAPAPSAVATVTPEDTSAIGSAAYNVAKFVRDKTNERAEQTVPRMGLGMPEGAMVPGSDPLGLEKIKKGVKKAFAGF